ncbi:MAG TPA: tRNA epoxyqueuosine(34) reductase QueG [bacterium]|nr:tRNA epoxyqueuosine(34) reductase QueG [bacterium]
MTHDPARKTAITSEARRLGIDGLGFTDASPLEQVRRSWEDAVGRGFVPADIVPKPSTILKISTPTRHMKSAKSVISAYQAYYTGEPTPDDPLVGPIAKYTVANHYNDLKRRLRGLADFIEQNFEARTKVMCCYVSLAEKALAARAGLGFYGKHGVIITPEHGSFVVLGEILTDLELESDAPLERSCGTCTRCIDACPVGALSVPYLVDRTLCIQAHCGRRTRVPPAVRQAWGGRFYGCTTCQDVCPYNAHLTPTSRRVEHGRVGTGARLDEVLVISEAEFGRRFRDNQIGMRERNVIRRDAIFAAGHSRSATLMGALETCARDDDPMVRQHAFWAIAMIQGQTARPLLTKALEGEADGEVRQEIKTLLDGIAALT